MLLRTKDHTSSLDTLVMITGPVSAGAPVAAVANKLLLLLPLCCRGPSATNGIFVLPDMCMHVLFVEHPTKNLRRNGGTVAATTFVAGFVRSRCRGFSPLPTQHLYCFCSRQFVKGIVYYFLALVGTSNKNFMTLSVAQASAEQERLGVGSDDWKPRQVTICGGGNGAHVAAGFLASRGIR